MRITKMHGCGNDYIYINGFAEQVAEDKKPGLVRYLSDRFYGVGSDGVIFINPSEEADFEMQMFNADGTRAEMCGNGIRCVGKYVYDKGLTDKTRLKIISAGQIRELELAIEEREAGRRNEAAGTQQKGRGTVSGVRVNMGGPILKPGLIPVIAEGDRVIQEPIVVGGRKYYMTCLSMGNPHAVVFTDQVMELKLDETGPLFENHVRFPNRINTEFVQVVDRNNIIMRVWERGAGETMACGTGSCAALAACVLNGLTADAITVKLLGGELFIEWDRTENVIFMTGPAVTVFEGEIFV